MYSAILGLFRFGRKHFILAEKSMIAIKRSLRATGVIKWLHDRHRNWVASSDKRLTRFVVAQLYEFNPLSIEKEEFAVPIGVIWEDRLSNLLLAQGDENVKVIRIPRSIFHPGWFRYLKTFISNSSGVPMGEYSLDHYFLPKYLEDRKSFKRYCEKVIDIVARTYGINTFIMPKMNDDWAVDCIAAINGTGYNLIVDDRESIITKKRMEVVPPTLRKNLDINFSYLYVHNNLHKKFFLDAGIPENKIVLNGMPQTDYWSSPSTWKDGPDIHPELCDEKFKILYFSFGPRTYMNFYYGDEVRDWTEMCSEYHNVLLQTLKRFPGRVQILYKTGGKPLRDLYPGFDSFLEHVQPYIEDGSLLLLDGRYHSLDLIRNSDLILGFQTSGLLEAMFTDRPIIYGAWGELFDDIKDTLLPLHACSGVDHVTSSGELCDRIKQYVLGKIDLNQTYDQRLSRSELVNLYFSNADGRVSNRLLRAAKDLAECK